jgi:hypothetical protein
MGKEEEERKKIYKPTKNPENNSINSVNYGIVNTCSNST